MANFQRVGSISNAHVGRDFGNTVQTFFASKGIQFTAEFCVDIGLGSRKKVHRFDFGSLQPAVLIECKCHRWTETGKIPSAKMTVWNEAMFYFHLAPDTFRKIFVVERSLRKEVSLVDHYMRCHGHLVPESVEFWEMDSASGEAMQFAR